MALIRSQLINRLWMKHDEFSKGDIELSVVAILDCFAKQLERDGRIEIRGVGSFCLHHQASRMARNPRTGESLIAPERARVHFKCSDKLLASVNTALHRKEQGEEVSEDD